MDYKNHTGRIILWIIAIICLIIFALVLLDGFFVKEKTTTVVENVPEINDVKNEVKIEKEIVKEEKVIEAETVFAKNLNIPWDFTFLPNEEMLVTERVGNLVHIGKDGNKKVIPLPHPVPKGEGGLLGIVLHPNFSINNFLYLYMTTQNTKDGTKNTVYRYKYENGKLLDEKIIIKNIPGAIYHDGGRMEFGPDGLLYITTGDAQTPAIAQDLKSLGGKILRLTDEGEIPKDNPFDSAVYSYGHRNPQGLAWDSEGRLWSTEHGRSGVVTGMDEVNLIVKGGNYGWPDIEGDKTKEGMKTPALHSGSTVTWAPASLLYLDGKLFFGGLKGESLYEAVLENGKVKELKSHFKNEYGRIRTVRVGPDGMIYFSTSNRDGRGKVIAEDDKIVRVDPKSL